MREHIIVPTERNLRFHRRLAACSLVLTVGMTGLAAWAFSVSGNPPAAMGLMTCTVGGFLGVAKIRGIAVTLRTQLRRLASHGRRFPATEIEVQRMRRGQATYFHVVVARFRDDRGSVHEALSETFDYDPWPLLRDRPIEVIADPFEPALCVVADDSLPPRHRRRLQPGQRARLAPADPLHGLIQVVGTSVMVALLAGLAVLVWKLVAGR